jgi:Hpt domain
MVDDRVDRIRVVVDGDLAGIVPVFLGNLQTHLERVSECLSHGDFVEIGEIGHRLKGLGGGYGFDAITEMGGRLELAGEGSDATAIRRIRAELGEYLSRVDVEYD